MGEIFKPEDMHSDEKIKEKAKELAKELGEDSEKMEKELKRWRK